MPEQQDVIERCARAIYKSRGLEELNPWDRCVQRREQEGIEPPFSHNQVQCLKDVRAILQELRTPDEEMIEAMEAVWRVHGAFAFRPMFIAAIDSALNQPGSGER